MTARSLEACAVRSEINVTPLIDVMLALVMILMVTAPLVMHRMPLPIGDGRSEAAATPALKLSILSTGELYLDHAPVSRAQLAIVLEAAAKAAVPPALEVRAEADARYDNVAAALAIAERAGLASIRVEAAR